MVKTPKDCLVRIIQNIKLKMGLNDHSKLPQFSSQVHQTVDLFGILRRFQHCTVISQRVVLWAEETSTHSWSRFCTVNCQPSVSNY